MRVLQSQIAMTPRGSYRTGLEKHLGETRDHAGRLQRPHARARRGRQPAAGRSSASPRRSRPGARARQDAARPRARFGRRGEGAQERQGRVRDRGAGDRDLHRDRAARQVRRRRRDGAPREVDPCRRAADARPGPEEIPKLTEAVVRADIHGNGSYDIATTGAADAAAPRAGDPAAARRPARRPSARQARKVPGAARAEGTAKGAVAREQDLPIARYDKPQRGRDPRAAARALPGRPGQGRRLRAPRRGAAPSPTAIKTLRGDEPWPGYDELTVDELGARWLDADETRREGRAYERAHKDRAGVMEAAERERANA